MNRILIFTVLIALVSCDNQSNKATTGERSKVNINEDWTYLENPTLDVNDARSMEQWESIDLPHTWNALDATDLDPGYRRSSSWYKKDLQVDRLVDDTVYQLYFEGSNIVTEVYLNGEKVGGHIGGYIGFTIDVTGKIKNGSNELMVRVDNSFDPEIIPSQKSDFFIFGGITRDVWLVTLPETHIDRVKITTP